MAFDPQLPKMRQPPRWMDKLLAFYCEESLLEDLQGDLYEYFERNCNNKGPLMAQLIYLIDVLKFFRTYTVKTPKLLRKMNYLAIFKNSFKTSYRSILRNRLFSGINIIGLAISMSAGLLVIALIMELYQFDRFHSKADRIYRINNTITSDDEPNLFASTSVLVGDKVRSEFSGAEKVVTTSQGGEMDAQYGEKVVPFEYMFATPEMAEVFDFEVLEGDFQKALTDLNSLAITKTAAERLFGKERALNKVITSGDGVQYTIQAVLADIPKKSHIITEAFFSFKTKEEEQKGNRGFHSWFNMWSNYVYVLSEESSGADRLQAQLDALAERENENREEKIALSALPLTGIVPGPAMSNMAGPSFDLSLVWILIALASIILLSACFNYTNLSVARSLRRSKEVGVRKTVGATGGHVFFQFVVEAVIITLIALFGAIPLFYLARPLLLETFDDYYNVMELQLTPMIVVAFFVYATLTGIVAGMFPAWIMSRMKVKSILSDLSSVKLFSNVSVRKALVVFQFSLSMVFIISAFIGFSQYQYMLNFDLGFNTDNVLNVSIQSNDYRVLENEFRKLPEVEDVSFSLMIPSVGSRYLEEVKDMLTNDSLQLVYNKVHPNYLRLHGHNIIAGADFDESYINAKDKKAIIVNKQFLQHFNISSPDEAIGREFLVDYRRVKARIIGVIDDFHFGTTEEKVGPYMFVNGVGTGLEEWPDYYEMNLKLKTNDVRATMSDLEEAWSRVDKVHQFKAVFYSESIEQAYDFLRSIIRIIGALAVTAISIAALGLLGMVVFTTETRLKEISIRKILGASEGNLLFLLGRSFFILMLVAAVLAIPLTYYVFDQYILSDYIYRPDISWLELVGGSMLIFAIGAIIVYIQTLMAARTNPANMLRKD